MDRRKCEIITISFIIWEIISYILRTGCLYQAKFIYFVVDSSRQIRENISAAGETDPTITQRQLTRSDKFYHSQKIELGNATRRNEITRNCFPLSRAQRTQITQTQTIEIICFRALVDFYC